MTPVNRSSTHTSSTQHRVGAPLDLVYRVLGTRRPKPRRALLRGRFLRGVLGLPAPAGEALPSPYSGKGFMVGPSPPPPLRATGGGNTGDAAHR